MEHDNELSVEMAATAMEHYQEDGGPALRDLLTDLMHWCSHHGHDFQSALNMAEIHYNSEVIWPEWK